MIEWLENKLALTLLRLDVARRRRVWNALCTLAPTVAGLVMMLEELFSPVNAKIWWLEAPDEYDADESDDDVDAAAREFLAAAAEKIERRSTPLGNDDYHITVTCLGALPGDENGLTLERVDDTLLSRPTIVQYDLAGNRWHDWKHGDGKQRLLAVLKQAVPDDAAPITLVRTAVIGHAVVGLRQRLENTR